MYVLTYGCTAASTLRGVVVFYMDSWQLLKTFFATAGSSPFAFSLYSSNISPTSCVFLCSSNLSPATALLLCSSTISPTHTLPKCFSQKSCACATTTLLQRWRAACFALLAQVEAQLPDKAEYVVKCELSGMQKLMYRQIQDQGLCTVGAGGELKVRSFLAIPHAGCLTVEFSHRDLSLTTCDAFHTSV